VPGWRPGHVTDLDQLPGDTRRAAAMQVHQPGAGGGGEFLVGLLGASVGRLEVTDQLSGDPAAGLADRVPGADRGQQRLGLRGGQALLRSARR
jgi:hypothetical protein